MRERLRSLVLLPLAALFTLTGCGRSPSTTLLTLDAALPPPGGLHSDYHGAPIAIPAVHLPAELDRPEFVIRVAPGQVKVDDFAHWVAPLGLLVRDTLVRDLSVRLPAGSVLPPGAVGGDDARKIDVTILSFTDDPGDAKLQAAFRELPGGPVRQVELTTPATAGGPVSSANAFGALIGLLADRIAMELR